METCESEQYELKPGEMQLVFVQTCYVNVNSRYSRNGEITRGKHIHNGQNVRPKNT